MISKETAGKILNIAEKMRVMIITKNNQEAWDIKGALRDCALKIDRGAEITSMGVAVTGYKPVTVMDYSSVNREKFIIAGAVFVTSGGVAAHLHIDPAKPVKIHLLPIEKGVST